jgi:peptidoglycan hydrolase-like protein with peptidoglycan-binding domain
VVAGAALVIVGGAAAAFALGWRLAPTQTPSKPALPPATAEVTRTTLVETRTLPGTLGYGDPAPVSANGAGTLTWIAPAGSIVERGEPLFQVDERPVVALYGSVPMYRTLRLDTTAPTEGTDVRQLQENLTDLGYKGVTIDGRYTSATAQAVSSWQADLGLTETGTVDLGQVVFIPGAVRIAEHTARLGDRLDERGVPVLTYTGTTRVVTVGLSLADRGLAVTGREVAVTVPGVGRVTGEIASVGTVITSSQQEGAPGGEGSTTSDARFEVTVTIADHQALGSLDASPVDVDFVSDERRDVLAVPVAALLALPAGGYGVEVVDGDTTRVVPVETGMFAAGLVEVSGDIAEGMKVGIPK